MFEKYCAEGVLVNIVILILIFAFLRSSYVYKRTRSNIYVLFGAVLMIIFCFFSFYDTDYYHYKSLIDKMSRNATYSSHMEDLYESLAKSINYSYNWFRIIVWGSASLILIRIFKNLKLDLGVGIYIFSMIFLLIFGYARVSLGMSIAFWGYSILVTRHYFHEKIVGISIIAISMYFHKSMFFIVPIFIASLVRFNRKAIFITLICFIAAVYVGTSYGLFYFIDNTNSEVIDANAAQRYASSTFSIHGIGGMLKTILYRAVYYLTPSLIVYIILKRDYKTLPDNIKRFMNCTLLIVVFTSIFLFNLGANSDLIYTRLLYFAMIPSSVSLTYIYCSMPKYSKYAAIIILIGMLATTYDISYKFYLTFYQ